MTTNDTSDNLDKKKYLRDRKKADIGNLMDIIVAKLNDGCTYSFVATGLGEWLHYIISPDEIRDLTSMSHSCYRFQKERKMQRRISTVTI